MKKVIFIVLSFIIIFQSILLPGFSVGVKAEDVFAIIDIKLDMASSIEALSGPVIPDFRVEFSDGKVKRITGKKADLYSYDDSTIKVRDGAIYPIKAGTCIIKVIYCGVERNLSFNVTPTKNKPKVISLLNNQDYILGVKGTVRLDQIKFTAELNDFTRSEVTGSQCKWSFSDPSIAQYSNGSINILKKGQTTATASINGVSTSLLLFAKEKSSDNYVLYEENFDGFPDGFFPEGWMRNLTGISKAMVKNRAFEIDAREYPLKVLLPEYLSKFGNYMIEADITNLGSNDPMRWNSIMFRIQNNNYPYYQMAVRKNATALNGVEFAELNSSNKWVVPKTTFFYEEMDPSKMYHYTVKAYNNKVQEWIGNMPLISADANNYTKGGIGFQANGSVMKIDNVKVTLLETPINEIQAPQDIYTRVGETDTKIALAPTVVTEIDNKKKFEEITAKKGQAATAILTINKKLEVLGNGTGNVVGTVSSFYELMKSNVIPAFRVNDADTAKAISDYLKNNGIEDAFVISTSPELVRQARENYVFIRGIIEFDKMTLSPDINELESIKVTANQNLSQIAVIPQEALSKSNAEYLQQRLLTVWAKETKGNDPNRQLVSIHEIITAGANGIITDAPEKARQAFAVYNRNTTIVRKPFLIGHRGVPDLAPENTIEGCKLAFELGANMVENDIRLTKVGADGKQHIVIMHDDTINRTTNGYGKVSNKSLEELGKYFVNKPFFPKYPKAKIPTLNNYLEVINGKDQVIFAEIKDGDSKIVDYYTEITKRVQAQKHLVTISSNINQLKRTKNQMPEMPLGLVRSGYDYKSDIYGSLRNILWQLQTVNASLMPDYNGIDVNIMEVCKHRGVTIWPWGFPDKNSIKKYFKMGVSGISTNYAEVLSNWDVEIVPKSSQITMDKGAVNVPLAIVKTYKGSIRDVVPEVVVISGGDVIDADGNCIRSKKSGEAYVMLRYTSKLSESVGDFYDIYTKPVKIKVN